MSQSHCGCILESWLASAWDSELDKLDEEIVTTLLPDVALSAASCCSRNTSGPLGPGHAARG
eukprot:379606-Heterocapsa_arctica.AAC.1